MSGSGSGREKEKEKKVNDDKKRKRVLTAEELEQEEEHKKKKKKVMETEEEQLLRAMREAARRIWDEEKDGYDKEKERQEKAKIEKDRIQTLVERTFQLISERREREGVTQSDQEEIHDKKSERIVKEKKVNDDKKGKRVLTAEELEQEEKEEKETKKMLEKELEKEEEEEFLCAMWEAESEIWDEEEKHEKERGMCAIKEAIDDKDRMQNMIDKTFQLISEQREREGVTQSDQEEIQVKTLERIVKEKKVNDDKKGKRVLTAEELEQEEKEEKETKKMLEKELEKEEEEEFLGAMWESAREIWDEEEKHEKERGMRAIKEAIDDKDRMHKLVDKTFQLISEQREREGVTQSDQEEIQDKKLERIVKEKKVNDDKKGKRVLTAEELEQEEKEEKETKKMLEKELEKEEFLGAMWESAREIWDEKEKHEKERGMCAIKEAIDDKDRMQKLIDKTFQLISEQREREGVTQSDEEEIHDEKSGVGDDDDEESFHQ